APASMACAIGRAGHAPAHALEAGAVGEELLAEIVELVPPRVNEAAVDDLHFLIARIETKHAARAQLHDAVRRLRVRARVDRLRQVEPAVDAPAQSVEI